MGVRRGSYKRLGYSEELMCELENHCTSGSSVDQVLERMDWIRNYELEQLRSNLNNDERAEMHKVDVHLRMAKERLAQEGGDAAREEVKRWEEANRNALRKVKSRAKQREMDQLAELMAKMPPREP